jgi:NAD-dependent SIR2 family protein deacetylase
VFQQVDRSVSERIQILARWLLQSCHTVVFTGAGISTESGLPDFRGPEGLWTRQEKGLPAPSVADWLIVQPNEAHLAIVEWQNMGKLQFLISQNVDNLHLKSGIHPELLAELHGNIFKVQCVSCGFGCDASPDLDECSSCGGRLVSTVVNFGDSIARKAWEYSKWHSQRCDLFIVVGSSLAVNPAAKLPRIAVRAGANLVIINQGKTHLDRLCHLRFEERIEEVLPAATNQLKQLIEKS